MRKQFVVTIEVPEDFGSDDFAEALSGELAAVVLDVAEGRSS